MPDATPDEPFRRREKACKLCGQGPSHHRLDGTCRIYVTGADSIQWSILPTWDEAAPITPEQLAAVQKWIDAKR